VPDFVVSAGVVVGVAGVVVACASASVTVKRADEATSPKTPAHPRKARALRRQICFGSERSLIFWLPVAALSEHVTKVVSPVIDLDQLGRLVEATLGLLSMGSTLSASEG
jgi:hypothetical protein